MKNLENLLLPLILEAGKIMTGARDIEGAVNEKGGDAANMVTVYDVAVQNFLMTEITKIIYEPWHYRYVGPEAAAEIYELGLTLEEYLDEFYQPIE